MPINEILAPAYLRVKASTPIAQHNHIFYFSLATAIGLLSGDVGQTNGFGDTISYTDILKEVFDRLIQSNGANIRSVDEIQIWRGVTGGANVFDGYANTPTLVTNSNPTVASAYNMQMYATATRKKFRLTAFDFTDARPQRFPVGSTPTLDDGSVNWYLLKSGIQFAHQDGERLTIAFSQNVGYNRKLARSYGRSIAP